MGSGVSVYFGSILSVQCVEIEKSSHVSTFHLNLIPLENVTTDQICKPSTQTGPTGHTTGWRSNGLVSHNL